MYYVTMSDKFMSGWGMSKNKINKLVIECNSYDEAIVVAQNARNRSEMRYVNICTKRPYYPSSRYHVSWKTREEYGSWFIPGYFRAS